MLSALRTHGETAHSEPFPGQESVSVCACFISYSCGSLFRLEAEQSILTRSRFSYPYTQFPPLDAPGLMPLPSGEPLLAKGGGAGAGTGLAGRRSL